jgi:recombinase
MRSYLHKSRCGVAAAACVENMAMTPVSRRRHDRQILQVLLRAISTVGQEAGGSLSALLLDHLHHWFDCSLSLAAGVTLCKGIWIGSPVPLGYEVRERQLVINEAEATTVRHIFTSYCELGSVRLLKEELDRNGVRSKIRVSKDGVESGGQAFSRGALYTLLRNPIYVGEIRHKGVCHPGQHAPTVDRAMWDKVAKLLLEHSTGCGAQTQVRSHLARRP